MNNLLQVAEGILDHSASDYLAINLESKEAVKLYADSCEVALNDEEANLVLNVCSKWIAGSFNNSDEYYRVVKQPLLSSNATL